MLVYNVPQVPDRTDAILHGGADPLPAMLNGIDFLNRNGASLIAIPCNTAHHWYTELAHVSRSPILHLADAAIAWMGRNGIESGDIGLLATSGTISSGFYQRRLAENGFQYRLPVEQDAVMESIRLVKKNQPEAAAALIEPIADGLVRDGCRCIVLGCTEVPVALRGYKDWSKVVDATEALARSCVDALTTPDKAALNSAPNTQTLFGQALSGPATARD